jgi:hypothetical protein
VTDTVVAESKLCALQLPCERSPSPTAERKLRVADSGPPAWELNVRLQSVVVEHSRSFRKWTDYLE